MLLWIPALALGAPLVPDDPGLPASVPPPTSPAPIVGGAIAEPGTAPEVGALFVADLFGCSAVLVAPDLVLSAGHCRASTTLERSVVLGAGDYEDGGERIAVVEDWRMPDHLETFDVAVFALERPATASPARILRTCEADRFVVDGATATIYGYGALDEAGELATRLLHQAEVTIEDADCSDPDRGCRAAVAPGGELRAGGDGVDTCVGDSGGPLFVDTPDGRILAAITSRSALPAPTPCGSGGLYVRADAIADWIEQTTGRTLSAPPCEPEPPPERPVAIDTGGAPVPDGPDRCGCATAPSSSVFGWLLAVSAAARCRGRRGRPEARPRPLG